MVDAIGLIHDPHFRRFGCYNSHPIESHNMGLHMATAKARHILVETEEQCLGLIEEIGNGADFGELAKQHSKCPSGSRGGDLGSFGRGQMVPEFDAVVFSGDLNKPLGPVKTSFGYHVLEVTERED